MITLEIRKGIDNMSVIRTRFAPSPTGYMHIGNLRTALYEYLIAKSQGGKFILRIEDTDQERLVEGAVDVIYDTLKQVGLVHDEGPDIGGEYGPYVQSERKDSYLPYAQELVEKGEAYYCFCTKETLDKKKEEAEARGEVYSYDRCCLNLSKEEIDAKLAVGVPYVIRQKMPTEGETVFEDDVYGRITVNNKELADQILIKTDGFPTYNFANVIDDHLMGITHVVRGSEYLSSAPKYTLLYKAFGWEVPEYVHLPLIVGQDGVKLSKRNGSASFQDLVKDGYLAEAIINYIALLGWAPEDNQEIFSLKELEQVFSAKRISKSPSAFDIEKLKWFNAKYILNMTEQQFHELAKPYYEGVLADNLPLEKVSAMIKQRVELLTQIPEMIDFLAELTDYDLEIYLHKKMKTTFENSLVALEATLPVLEAIDDWSLDVIHDKLMELPATLECKNGQVLWPIRTALSGKAVTPGGAMEIAEILGREESIRRIRVGIERLKNHIDGGNA